MLWDRPEETLKQNVGGRPSSAAGGGKRRQNRINWFVGDGGRTRPWEKGAWAFGGTPLHPTSSSALQAGTAKNSKPSFSLLHPDAPPFFSAIKDLKTSRLKLILLLSVPAR